jgi:hypothetical protein
MASVEDTTSAPHSPDPPILQPQQNFYDEAAEHVSNLIDEELKVRRPECCPAHCREITSWRAVGGTYKAEGSKKETGQRCLHAVNVCLLLRYVLTIDGSWAVMLLGQAESGKSTLQKQFQLYYASQSLDYERPSWRPVVHFNVIKAVRMILHELDYEFTPRSESSFTTTNTSEGDIARDEMAIQSEISHIRQRLYPLIAIEDSLASELNGGISVTGGRKGIFVRSGWQALVSSTNWSKSGGVVSIPSSSPAATLAAKTLLGTKAQIEELWRHPAVKAMVRLRKLRLDDAACLCVSCPFPRFLLLS